MMDPQTTSRLESDLFLPHAPSVLDFCERDDMLFAYLSDSDSVNVTSIYEMYPIGWFSIQQRLADYGRWFDDFTVPRELIGEVLALAPVAAPAGG